MKRSDNLAWSQLTIGIFILIALACAAVAIMLMGEKTKFFIPKGELSVVMSDVAGLKVGAPVWLAGVDVGIVREVRFRSPQQSNEVEIVLEVDRESLRKIGPDSLVMVKTRGLMGEKYVDITPTVRVLGEPPGVIQGVTTPKLDDVIQKAGIAVDRLNGIVDRVNRGEGSLGRFMQDARLYDNLNRLTFELSSLSSSINRGEGTLGKLTRNDEPYERMLAILERAEATIKDIQSADGTMGRLVRDRQLYDKLVALADKSIQAAEDVRQLNRKLTSTDSTIGKLFSDRELYDKGVSLLERAESAVQSYEDVAFRLHRSESTAGSLLNDRELYDKLNKMVDSLDTLVKDVKENPRRYIKFSLF